MLLVLLIMLALSVAAALLAPGLILQLLNFAPQGDIETFWEAVDLSENPRDASAGNAIPRRLPEALVARQPTPTHTPLPPSPAPTVSATLPPTLTPSPTGTVNPYADWFASASVPPGVVLTSEGFLTLGLQAGDTFASALWFGESITGEALGIVEFQETAVPNLCEKLFNGCRTERYRIDRVDFRPGGLMVYGSINIGVLWQSLGVALLLDDDRRSLRVAGVIIGSMVYQVPSSGPIANVLNDLAGRGNTALSGLRVQGSGYDLPLTELFFDDDRFIAVLG